MQVQYSRSLTSYREHLAALLAQYGDVLSASCDSLTVRWGFEIIFDQKAFYSISNSLKVGGMKLPVIVTDRKTT